MALRSPIRVGNSGHRVAYGQFTTASASDTVVTGLRKVVHFVASMDDAPVLGASSVSAAIPASGGSVTLKSWKATATGDATPVAATTFGKKVNWMAIGY